MTRENPEMIATISVINKADMEQQIESAVAAARQQATRERPIGVLVTRIGYTTITVELSPDVPYGITMERTIPAINGAPTGPV